MPAVEDSRREGAIVSRSISRTPPKRSIRGPVKLPYELQIGWQYLRAGRRNGHGSFIAGIAMLGIALGVAALIVVVPVVNGFQTEVRDRMLSVVGSVPTDPRAADVVTIACASLLLSFLATLCPSWSTSRMAPAEALRHEWSGGHPHAVTTAA